ncbi:MAG TPA: glycosyltransferase [Mycobacteriales bacterium]|nr:glycosyltransferase [Mycobacteriales bacterium]
MIVYLAGARWDAVAGTDRHLAEALGRHEPVLWVDPPMSWIGQRRRKVTAARLSTVAPGVTRLRTVAPPGVTRPGIRVVARLLVRRGVRRLLARTGQRARAVVLSSPEPLLPGWSGVTRIYYATDDFVAGAPLLGFTRAYAEKVQAANLAAADHVLAVSETLVETLRAGGRPVALMPNGCAPVAPAPPAPEVTLPGPVAGVLGQLNERLDLDFLAAVAADGQSLLLVGPRYEQDPETRRRLDELIARPTVQWVGRQPAERLPEFLAAMDVGLTPYRDTAFNRASFPLKTLEYLAAGLPVVSTDLPSARWLGTDHVDLASAADKFAALVRSRLAEPGTAELAADRRALAAGHSWDARAEQLLALIR